MSKCLSMIASGRAQRALPTDCEIAFGATGRSNSTRCRQKRPNGKNLRSPMVFFSLIFGLNWFPTQSASETLTLPCSFCPGDSFEIEVNFEKSQMTLTSNLRQTYPIIAVTENFVTAAGQVEYTLNGEVIFPTDSDGGSMLVLDRKIGEFHFATIEGRCQESGCDIGSMRTNVLAGSCKVSEY